MKRARTARRSHARAPAAPAGPATAVETITVPIAGPRNPYVAAAHGRKAGAHGGGSRKRRQQEKKELRAQLREE